MAALVWAATTKNLDYITVEGLKRAVGDGLHRKEVVAGVMGPLLLAREFVSISPAVGDAG